MSKKGISQIKGPSEIRLGETAYYEVSRIYDPDDKKKVDTAKWKLYVLDFKTEGNWQELKPKAEAPSKIGYRVPLTITKQSLVGSELMLEAYIYEPEKRIPPGLRIKVLPGLEKKITRVDLFKVDDTPIKEDTVMKYGQTIKVKVYTQNMQNEMIKLSLYEDDAQGGGDSPKNKNNRVAYTTKALNKKGFLVHEFKLNIDFTKIANAFMDGSHDKLHEYYVVVETAEHKSVSKNVDVQNPDYVKVQTVSSGVDTEKIYEGIVIEEVIITGKYKKQPGINPLVGTGNQVATVAKPDEKEKKKEEVCEYEARVRAFLRMLRVGEGTGELIKSSIYNKETKKKEIIYIPHDFDKGYTIAFGGNIISNLSDHPRINYGGSTAAGAYQVMGYTWDDTNFSLKRKEYKVSSFSKVDQDKFAIILLKFHSGCSQLIDLIINNEIEKAIRNCASRIWASLPEKEDNSRYSFKGNPQPVTPMKTILKHYEQFYENELVNKSPLYLKKGFLKEFGYNCCNQKPTSVTKSVKGYNIDKAVNHINNNALPKSLGKCALYVRQAINAGGISLMKDKEARITFFAEIQENADYLEFPKSEYFTFTPNRVNIKDKKSIALDTSVISIKCIKEFTTDQTIELKAFKKDKAGQLIEAIAGKMNVWANDVTKQKKKDVVFVTIKTPEIMIGTGEKVPSINDEKNRINQYLGQAYIKLSDQSDIIELDLSMEVDFMNFITNSQIDTTKTNNGVSLKNYLKSKLEEQYKETYKNHFKAFYFAENGYDPSGSTVSGYSEPSADYVVVFSSKNDQTAVHEFLHSMLLPHTFTNKEASPNALFTYKYRKTDNLMDYSHQFGNDNKRCSLFYWQWKQANTSIK